MILLSAIPNRATLDLAIEAADCGHLIFAALHTPDASRTGAYLLRLFSPIEERTTRVRLARSLRAVVSQRLFPRNDRPGQVAIFEILLSTPRIREGSRDGMQGFESELWKLQQAGVLTKDAGWEDLFGDWIPAPYRTSAILDPRRIGNASVTRLPLPSAGVES